MISVSGQLPEDVRTSPDREGERFPISIFRRIVIVIWWSFAEDLGSEIERSSRWFVEVS